VSRIALLAAGPSLPEVYCDEFMDDYELIVAVNTAGWKFTHHWLFAFDRQIFTPVFERKPGVCLPLVGVQTNKPHREEAVRLGWRAEIPGPYYGLGLTAEQRARAGTERCIFTFPNALRFCLSRFPRASLDIYGMDYAIGKPCVGGASGDRGEKRFRREALWVREFWEEERITVYGRAKRELLDFLAGRCDTWSP